MRHTRLLLASILLGMLTTTAACGGGGGGGPAPEGANLPLANAGPDQTVRSNAYVFLDGSASELGTDNGTYDWEQIDGPPVAIENGEGAIAAFFAPIVDRRDSISLMFRLTVEDETGADAESTVTITVRRADYLVYVADAEVPGTDELFAWDPDTGERLKLSGLDTGSTTADVVDFAVAPDRRAVVYVIERDAPGGGRYRSLAWRELPNGSAGGLAAPIDFGSPGVRGEIRGRPIWAPDSSCVAFIADLDEDEAYELWCSDVEPGLGAQTPRRLSPTLPNGADVQSIVGWSPDGSLLAYISDERVVGWNQIYAAHADGSGSYRLSGRLREGGLVEQIAWSPDGQWLAYKADQDEAGVEELFASSADGSINKQLNAPLVTGGDVRRWFWSPDSSRIAYTADAVVDGRVELFVAGVTVRLHAPLHPPIAPGGGLSEPVGWSPDGSLFAYVADQNGVGVRELFVATNDGTDSRLVSGAMVTGGDIADTELCETRVRWSGDAQYLVYVADQDVDGTYELFSVNVGSGDVRKISGPAQPSTLACDPAFLDFEEGFGVIYLADAESPGRAELFATTTVAIEPPRRLAPPLPDGRRVTRFEIAPDRTRLVYQADQDTAGVDELYAVDLTTAPGTSTKVTPDLPAGASVKAWAWAR
ncbi:MAG: hypothetical protein QNJ98_11210 [Planctomycetota bacterium]|nr:hypothetical protein [Planctomycetota bacterium]